MQIWHVGRAGTKFLNPNEEEVVSASAIATTGNSSITGRLFEVPCSLSISEIKELVQDHYQAAKNAIEAGFDGVEVAASTGYLLDQFINSNSNKRSDIYSGSVENRCRFPPDVIGAVVEAIGEEKTTIRIFSGDNFGDMNNESPVDTYGYLISELQKIYPQLAYIHLIEVRSSFLTEDVNTIDSLDPYRERWNGPIISANGFSNATDHAIDIAERTGGHIAFSRTFLANPNLPERLRRNHKLNKYDRVTFYTNDDTGYLNYPFAELDNIQQ